MAILLGNETAGAASFGMLKKKAYLSKRECTETGKVDTLHQKITTGTGTTFRLALYTDSAGKPGTLLAETATITVATATELVVEGAITPTEVTKGTIYWIGMVAITGTAKSKMTEKAGWGFISTAEVETFAAAVMTTAQNGYGEPAPLWGSGTAGGGTTIKTLTATLEFAGTIQRFVTKILTASFQPEAVLKKVFNLPRTFLASLTSTGVLIKAFTLPRTFVASLGLNNSFGKKTLGANFDNGETENFKQVMKFQTNGAIKVGKLLLYVFKPAGETHNQKLKAIIYTDNAGVPETLVATGSEVVYEGTEEWLSLPISASLAANTNYWIGFIEGATSVGFGVRYDSVTNARAFNANSYASGPTGTFGAATKDAEEISIFAIETIPRNTFHGLTAALSFLGVLPKVFNIAKKVTGALSFAGTRGSNVLRSLTATVSFLGSTASRIVAHLLTGALSFTGAMTARVIKVFAATLSFAGTLPRNVIRKLSALVSFSTTLGDYTIHALSASLSFLGTLRKTFTLRKALSGALSFFGNLPTPGGGGNVVKVLTATLSFITALPRSITRSILANLSPTSLLPRSVVRIASATLSFVGTVKTSVAHRLQAILSFSTTLFDHTIHPFTASLSFIGSLPHTPIKVLSSSLSFIGKIAITTRQQVLQAVLSFAARITRPSTSTINDYIVLPIPALVNSLTLEVTGEGRVIGLINRLEQPESMEFISIVRKREIERSNR